MKRMKFFYSAIIAICVLGSLVSCENPNEIGFDLNNEIAGKSIYSDTLSLDVSTVLSDSAVNGASNYVMAGYADDPVFGAVSASSYFQPTLKFRSGVVNVIDTFFAGGSNPIVDSLRLRLVNTGLLFGDTLSKATFGVYRLKNSVRASNYDGKESIETETAPLLKFTLTPNSFKNKTKDSLVAYYITLPKEIATELFAASLANPTNNTKLTSQFKGLAILPEANAKTVYTFLTGPYGQLTSNFTVYWHNQGEDTKRIYNYDINGPRHSYVKFNRSTSNLKDLNTANPELPISKTNTFCYVQAGSGISTKVNFSNLSKLGTNVKVSRAVLEFTAPKIYNTALFPKIFSFAIAEADTRNQHLRNAAKQLTYITPIGTDLSSGLQSLVDTSNVVSVDLTNLVQRVVNKKQFNTSILLLPAVPTVDGNSILSNDNLRRIVFLKPKLKIYYTKN
jgi:Domain of unknown function (DUF4270)